MAGRQIRWDCSDPHMGCYLENQVVKFNCLDDCLPRETMGFTDGDALCEIGGNLLLQEWKPTRLVPDGQRIMFENLTRWNRVVGVLVHGRPSTMEVYGVAVVIEGVIGPWREMDFGQFRCLLIGWGIWAAAHPASKGPIIVSETLLWSLGGILI